MAHEVLSNGALLLLFKQVSQELITNGGGRARSRYYEVEAEVLKRMGGRSDDDQS